MSFDYTNYLEVDATVEGDFEFTDRAGNTDSGLQTRNTAGQWCLETNGGTTSSGTGPAANPTSRSAYIYTETSTPSASSTWAMKRNDSFDSTTQYVYLDLIYNVNIDTGSEYYVEYATASSPNETTDWTILETIQGTATDSWISDTYNFSGVTSSTLWIRIRFDSENAYTNDLAFSTWREYSVDHPDTATSGMTMASADVYHGTLGAENPGTFTFEQSLDWGAITIALRPITGQTDAIVTEGDKFSTITTPVLTLTNDANVEDISISGDVVVDSVINLNDIIISGDMEITNAGTYEFSNVIVNGDVTNSDSGGNVKIYGINGTEITTTEPGTGNDQVDIQIISMVTITNLKDNTEVRVYEDGTTNEIDGVENAISGTTDDRYFSFTYTVGSLVDIVVHNVDYKYYTLSNYTMPLFNTPVEVKQRFDRNYLNF